MGKQSNSSAVVIGVVLAVVLVVGLFGGLVVVGSLFWVKVAEKRAVLQSNTAMELISPEIVETRPELNVTFEVTLDRDGNMKASGDTIDREALRARLLKLKEETSNSFSVQINADSECPVKHVVSVADMCKDAGVIDYKIATSAK